MTQLPFRGRSYRLLASIAAVISLRLPLYFFLNDALLLAGAKRWSEKIALWCRWDCTYFARFSDHYRVEDSAFFPLFSLLLKGVRGAFSRLSGPEAAIFASNGLSLVAYLLIYQWGRCYFKSATEERPAQAWFLVLTVAIFPFSQQWSHGYSEPLFACLLALFFTSVLRGQLYVSAATAGLLAVTRPQGVWILGVFVLSLLFLNRRVPGKKMPSWVRFFTLTLLGSLPVAAFLAWQTAQTGNPFFFLTLQKNWGRSFSFWQGLKDHLPIIFALKKLSLPLFTDWLLLVGSWCAFFHFWRKGSWANQLIAIVTLVLAELPLFVGGYYSYSRFLSTNLGLFLWGTEVLLKRPWVAIGFGLWACTQLGSGAYHWVKGLWCG